MHEQVFLSISRTELSDIIANAVSKSIDQLNLNSASNDAGTKYLTSDAAAQYVGKTVVALRQAVYRRELPSIKRGNNIYFLKEDLDSWMFSGMRRPIDTQADPAENLKPLRNRKGGSK